LIMKDLQVWLERVKSAGEGGEIFQILEEFRPGDWTDNDRSLMSKTYIAALAKLGTTGAAEIPKSSGKAESQIELEVIVPEGMSETPSEQEEVAEDESVWYEKL
jgi:hypothetical protein